MFQLRLLPAHSAATGHQGEALTCAYTPDGQKVLSGGWDGWLRVWNADDGALISTIRASAKPICACAVSPDGQHYLSACLDGFLAHWDAQTHQKTAFFLAHWRPISSIAFGTKGQMLATASWDKNLILWDLSTEQGWRTLAGHKDIVAGCRFTPDGRMLLSWSHDGNLGLWDVARAERLAFFAGHRDRVTAGAICPNGRWAVSGSRDRTLRLWDLSGRREAACRLLAGEVVACFFLADQVSVLVVDASGCLSIHRVPELLEQRELLTELKVVQGDLSPAGDQLALCCADGTIRLVAIGGVPMEPLRTAAWPAARQTSRRLRDWLKPAEWQPRVVCNCPVCRLPLTIARRDTRRPVLCPMCRRLLLLEPAAR